MISICFAGLLDFGMACRLKRSRYSFKVFIRTRFPFCVFCVGLLIQLLGDYVKKVNLSLSASIHSAIREGRAPPRQPFVSVSSRSFYLSSPQKFLWSLWSAAKWNLPPSKASLESVGRVALLALEPSAERCQWSDIENPPWRPHRFDRRSWPSWRWACSTWGSKS